MHKYKRNLNFLKWSWNESEQLEQSNKNNNYKDGSHWCDGSREESGHTSHSNQPSGAAILKEI